MSVNAEQHTAGPSISPARDAVLADGYAVFKQLLGAGDVEKIRAACLAHLRTGGVAALSGRTQPNAFHHIPEIRWLLDDPRILGAFAAASGSERLWFTFHSDAHKDIVGGWHRDTDGYLEFGDTLNDDFGVYKAAIYLQDHSRNDRGFTCRPGSHREVEPTGAETSLATEPGDVVVFDVRLLHRGQKPDWFEQGLRLVRHPESRTRLRTAYANVRGLPPKMSVFFTFGVCNDQTLAFARGNVARQALQNKTGADIVSAQVQAYLDERGVEYCNPAALADHAAP